MAAATIVDGLCAEGRVSEKPLSRPLWTSERPSGPQTQRLQLRIRGKTPQKRSEPIVAPKSRFA